jgi:hypothetical protein
MRLKTSRAVFQCPRCAKELSPTSGTIFHKSRLPLTIWFQAMHLMITSPEGISARELQRQLHLRSYRAAWFLAQKIRTAMTFRREAPLWKEAQVHPRFVTRQGKSNRRGLAHGWSSKYHHAYAAESAYRAAGAEQIGRAFERLLAVCLAHPPATLRDIKA